MAAFTNKTNSPSVDVVLPVYNGELFIAEQLDSILIQQGVNVRVLALDDASTDRSLEILRRYEKAEPRLQVLCNDTNQGLIASLSKLLSEVTAPFFALADQDDVWDSTKLSQSIAELRKGFEMVYSNVRLVDEELTVTTQDYWSDFGIKPAGAESLLSFVFKNPAIGHTIVGHSRVLPAALPLPQNLHFHEARLAAAAALIGEISWIGKPLGCYRIHGSNVVGPRKQRLLGRTTTQISNRTDQIKNRQATRAAGLEAVAELHPRYLDLAASAAADATFFRRFRFGPRLLRERRQIGWQTLFRELAAHSLETIVRLTRL